MQAFDTAQGAPVWALISQRSAGSSGASLAAVGAGQQPLPGASPVHLRMLEKGRRPRPSTFTKATSSGATFSVGASSRTAGAATGEAGQA